MEKQKKFPEKERNEVEASNIPITQLKTLVLWGSKNVEEESMNSERS